jgi:hypothetical protein
MGGRRLAVTEDLDDARQVTVDDQFAAGYGDGMDRYQAPLTVAATDDQLAAPLTSAAGR